MCGSTILIDQRTIDDLLSRHPRETVLEWVAQWRAQGHIILGKV